MLFCRVDRLIPDIVVLLILTRDVASGAFLSFTREHYYVLGIRSFKIYTRTEWDCQSVCAAKDSCEALVFKTDEHTCATLRNVSLTGNLASDTNRIYRKDVSYGLSFGLGRMGDRI